MSENIPAVGGVACWGVFTRMKKDIGHGGRAFQAEGHHKSAKLSISQNLPIEAAPRQGVSSLS